MAAQVYLKNDNNIVIRRLRLESTQSFISDATLAAAVYDQNGTVISGASAISLSYTASSDGEYRGLLPYTVQLSEGTYVTIIVTSSNYPGIRIESEPLLVKKRRS